METLKLALNRIFTWLEVDQAIIYFLFARVFSLVASPILLWMVSTYLTPVEQGYYFTLYSLTALSIFFELGLGMVITQFASHEFAHLRWTDDLRLEGDRFALSRLSSLLSISLKWYGAICGLFLMVVIPLGLYLFGQESHRHPVPFLLPMILMILFFALGTFTIPLASILEGCGKVGEIHRLRFLQSVCSSCTVITVLFFGGGLLAVPAEYIATFFVFAFWLLKNYRRPLTALLDRDTRLPGHNISWRRGVLPMQWRVALTWISAYFQNYLFVPVLFAYRGAVEAGQMGMTLRLITIIYTFSLGWLFTKAPYLGALIQKKDFQSLDRLALASSLRTVATAILGSLAFLTLIRLAGEYFPHYAQRVLPQQAVVALCLMNVCCVIMTALGTYLRAFKIEPYLGLGVVTAAATTLICLLTARYYNASIMALAYTGTIVFISMPLSFYIFLRRRRVVLKVFE